MKKTIFFILFSFASLASLAPLLNVFADDNTEGRREELIRLIDEELIEVTRLNKQLNSGNPKLLVRMAELYLEKARLIQEKENLKFLEIPSAERVNLKKSDFFQESRKFFVYAQKVGSFILKKFPNFEDKAEVVYIMAHNAKEFQDHQRAKQYFQLALKMATPGTKIYHKSMLAVADNFYNERRYSDAAHYYEQSLKDRSDRWWTKDSYNLAWCYYRLKKINNAIILLKDVERLSKDGNHVDVSNEASRDLALFYSEIGKIDEAVEFYKKNGKDVKQNLLKVAKYLNGQGKDTAAIKIYEDILNEDVTPEQEVECRLALITSYARFNNYNTHLSHSQKLVGHYKNGLFNEQQKEAFQLQLKTMAATLQKQVTSGQYKDVKKSLNEKANMAVAYFRILSELGEAKAHRYSFLAAETYYAIGDYEQALDLYTSTYEQAEKEKDSDFQKKSVEGMLAALGKGAKGKNPGSADKYTAVAYMNYLRINPSGEKSDKIAQRLFNIYFDKKDIGNCEKVLNFYKKNFPQNTGTQEQMLARIMDHYKDKKDKEALLSWIKRIKSGEFQISDKYAKTLGLFMMALQFENVENANSRGDKVKALKSYVYIFKDKESTAEAKKNAAYNIAVLFHQLGNIEKTFEWLNKATALMTVEDLEKYNTSYMLISSDLFGRRQFEKSYKVNEIVFNKLCNTNSSNKNSLFKNSYVLALADGKVSLAKKIVEKGEGCRIAKNYLSDARVDIARYYMEEKNWNELAHYLQELDLEKSTWPQIIPMYFSLYNAYEKNAQKDLSQRVVEKINTLYQTGKASKASFPLESLDIVAHFRIKVLYEEFKRIDDIKLSFPEKIFNDGLKKKFKILDSITGRSLEVLGIGSGIGIVRTYKYLIESYLTVISEIKNFKPEGKSEEYLISFNKGMEGLVAPLEKKVEEFRAEAKKHISQESILSKDNAYFLLSGKGQITPEYYFPKGAMIMDKGGN